MESILEQLMYSTVPIETFNSDEDPIGLGTGFILSHSRDGNTYPYLVTNKHVIRGAASSRIIFTMARDRQPIMGQPYCLELAKFGESFFPHPTNEVDVAVLPFGPFLKAIEEEKQREIFYKMIPSDMIPSSDALKDFDALEEVTFVGYPAGIWDKKNLLPVFRKGITATPITVDYQGQKQFLIDAAVFQGSSGSPVFKYIPGWHMPRMGPFTVSPPRIYFLGVLASGYSMKKKMEVEIYSEPSKKVLIEYPGQALNLGIVFRAETIVEAIEANLKQKGLIQ